MMKTAPVFLVENRFYELMRRHKEDGHSIELGLKKIYGVFSP